MTNEDGTVWITFNGEIYNHAALRARARGARATSTARTPTPRRSSTSTRRRARAASSGSTGCSRFAIWDSRTRELLPGPRPPRHQAALLRPDRRAGFVFGSEIKALLAHPAITPDLDEEAFFHYLTFVCTPAPLTMFKGIRKLAPAERMTRARRRLDRRSDTYWTPDVRRRPRARSPGCSERRARGAAHATCCASRSASG